MNKQLILETVRQKISDKIRNLENLIAGTRESNRETKSSMGDKYETGREMLQQEINNLQVQLNENMNAFNSLKLLSSGSHQVVGNGSLVETDNGFFYIAVSLGEINSENQKIFVISQESPLAKAMQGKRSNDQFIVNNLSQTIKNIW